MKKLLTLMMGVGMIVPSCSGIVTACSVITEGPNLNDLGPIMEGQQININSLIGIHNSVDLKKHFAILVQDSIHHSRWKGASLFQDVSIDSNIDQITLANNEQIKVTAKSSSNALSGDSIAFNLKLVDLEIHTQNEGGYTVYQQGNTWSLQLQESAFIRTKSNQKPITPVFDKHFQTISQVIDFNKTSHQSLPLGQQLGVSYRRLTTDGQGTLSVADSLNQDLTDPTTQVMFAHAQKNDYVAYLYGTANQQVLFTDLTNVNQLQINWTWKLAIYDGANWNVDPGLIVTNLDNLPGSSFYEQFDS